MNTMWNTLRIYSITDIIYLNAVFIAATLKYRSTVQAQPEESFYGYTGFNSRWNFLFSLSVSKVNSRAANILNRQLRLV